MADFSPTGYWAHYGLPADGAPVVTNSLPVARFDTCGAGYMEDDYAMVCDRRGRLVQASDIKGFLHVSASPRK